MSDLSLWRAKEWLTLHQAASLSCGVDPSNANETEAPAGWHGIYEALLEELFDSPMIIASTLKPEDVILGRNGWQEPMPQECFVRQTAIGAWLDSKGIRPAYFFPNDEAAEPRPKHGYSTSLMDAVDAVVARYYGENYDPSNPDSIPRQAHVIEWLKETYSLSSRQAESVDIVARPRHKKA